MPRLLVGWPLAAALLAPLLTAPALAGSVTADSVWDRNDARQRALQQVPKGATVNRTSCEVISVGMGNDRYRCTVWYGKEAAPTAPPQAGPQVPGTSP